MNNLVSIIMPLYNASQFVSQAIESVINQTHSNWEIIIVDDCSTDNSVAVVKEYTKKDKRIVLLQLDSNSGPSIARNTAIKKATGRYIAFLDADDLWLEDKLTIQIKFMENNDLCLTCSSYFLIDENNNKIGKFITKATINYKMILKSCSVCCSTAIYDTEKIGKIYMYNILKRQDYVLWLTILKDIQYTKSVIEPLVKYRILKSSVSSNKIKVAQYQWKVYREIEKLGLLKSIYYWLHYVCNGINKYKLVSHYRYNIFYQLHIGNIMKKIHFFILPFLMLFASITTAHGPVRGKMTATVTIAASPRTVWAVIADYGDMSWHPAIAKVEADNGNNKGSVRVLTLKDGGTITEQLKKHDDNKMSYKYKITQMSSVKTIQHAGKDEYIPVLPVENYQATLSVKGKNGKTVVSWVATYYRGYVNNNPPPELNEAAADKSVTAVLTTGLTHLMQKFDSRADSSSVKINLRR